MSKKSKQIALLKKQTKQAKKATKSLKKQQKKQLMGLHVSSLTREELADSTVAEFNLKITDVGLDHINKIISTEDYGAEFKENLVGYSGILSDGKFTAESYINAVKYVTFKMMGYTNKKAYAYAFPERWNKMELANRAKKDMMSTVAVYNRGILVQKLLAQSAIRISVYYSDEYHKAVRRSIALTTCGNSAVEQKAAAALLQHLKPDEAEINSGNGSDGVEEESGNDLLKEMIIANTKLAQTQAKAIEDGSVSVGNIIRTRIIPGEVIRHE